jgi:hypothetical protein
MTVIGRVIAGISIVFAAIKVFTALTVVIVSVVIIVQVMTDVLYGNTVHYLVLHMLMLHKISWRIALLGHQLCAC